MRFRAPRALLNGRLRPAVRMISGRMRPGTVGTDISLRCCGRACEAIQPNRRAAVRGSGRSATDIPLHWARYFTHATVSPEMRLSSVGDGACIPVTATLGTGAVSSWRSGCDATSVTIAGAALKERSLLSSVCRVARSDAASTMLTASLSGSWRKPLMGKVYSAGALWVSADAAHHSLEGPVRRPPRRFVWQ